MKIFFEINRTGKANLMKITAKGCVRPVSLAIHQQRNDNN